MFRSLTLAFLLLLAGCGHDLSVQDVNIAGLVPALDFSMQDVNTGKPVTAADFRGKVTLLYFGYTNCPDVCPATLYNVDRVLRRLGRLAGQVNFLFVTVDPNRDSPAALAQYVGLSGPDMTGLRGSADQLFTLARRYRVVFSVTRPSGSTPYEVTHSSAIYVFDAKGQAQFLIAGMDTTTPDIPGITADLRNIITGQTPMGWWDRLANWISAV
jgi:protein SCO1/2